MKLGKRPQPLLRMSLLPLLEANYLANPYRCAMSGDQGILIDISEVGEVLALHLFTPKINFNWGNLAKGKYTPAPFTQVLVA